MTTSIHRSIIIALLAVAAADLVKLDSEAVKTQLKENE
jgi:hypothetical protein